MVDVVFVIFSIFQFRQETLIVKIIKIIIRITLLVQAWPEKEVNSNLTIKKKNPLNCKETCCTSKIARLSNLSVLIKRFLLDCRGTEFSKSL